MNLKKVADSVEKNKPKQDGSGKGLRLNQGRGGCPITKTEGQGRNNLKWE